MHDNLKSTHGVCGSDAGTVHLVMGFDGAFIIATKASLEGREIPVTSPQEHPAS